MFHSVAGGKGVSAVVVTGRHRIVGGEEKGGRGKNGFGFRVGFRFRRRGVEWRKWVKWSRVEWRRIVNAPRMTKGQN